MQARSNGLAAATLIGATGRTLRGRTSRTESLKLQTPVSMCRPSVSRASQVWSASAELAVLQAGAVGVLSVLVLRNLRRGYSLGVSRPGLGGLSSHVDAGDRVDKYRRLTRVGGSGQWLSGD